MTYRYTKSTWHKFICKCISPTHPWHIDTQSQPCTSSYVGVSHPWPIDTQSQPCTSSHVSVSHSWPIDTQSQPCTSSYVSVSHPWPIDTQSQPGTSSYVSVSHPWPIDTQSQPCTRSCIVVVTYICFMALKLLLTFKSSIVNSLQCCQYTHHWNMKLNCFCSKSSVGFCFLYYIS